MAKARKKTKRKGNRKNQLKDIKRIAENNKILKEISNK